MRTDKLAFDMFDADSALAARPFCRCEADAAGNT